MQMGDAGPIGKKNLRECPSARGGLLKSLAAAPWAIRPEAAAFALFIGYVLSECSGVTVKKLTDQGQLLLLLGGLLLGRLLGLLGLLLRSHVQLLYRLFGSERLMSPPQNVINMNYLLFEMQLCRGFRKSPKIAKFRKSPIYKD
jgi:hypothetical protein